MLSPFVRQRLASLTGLVNAGDPAVLSQLVESGQVMLVIDRTYPPAATVAAIRHLLDGNARGKIVIGLVREGAVR